MLVVIIIAVVTISLCYCNRRRKRRGNPLPPSVSYFLCLSFPLLLPPSLTPSLTLSLPLSFPYSLSLPLSIPPSLTPSLTPSLLLCFSYSLSPFLTPFLHPSLTHSLSLSFPHSLSPSLTPSLPQLISSFPVLLPPPHFSLDTDAKGTCKAAVEALWKERIPHMQNPVYGMRKHFTLDTWYCMSLHEAITTFTSRRVLAFCSRTIPEPY